MSKPESVISISKLNKVYASGLHALSDVDLEINKGEIFALLGPNGAGKTTLINIVCGIANPSGGKVLAGGFDILSEYRKSRSIIGLVPQELTADMFEPVISTVKFSRGLYGKTRNDKYVEKILRDLTLWDKRDSKIMTLSGGMKRRVMIAKALSHEPEILFLDEPTAGVDVSLRKEMWQMVRELRKSGVTIILTTHYIEEAQEMADRIGVINKGKIILVEEKNALMRKLGKKQLSLTLKSSLAAIPQELTRFKIDLSADGTKLVYNFDAQTEQSEVPELLRIMAALGIEFKDLQTSQSSLEDIFVQLVGAR